MKLVSRAEARATGLVRFFDGTPCSNGHVAERITKGGRCLICARADTKDWTERNKDRQKALVKRWMQSHPEKALEAHRRYRLRHKERKAREYKIWSLTKVGRTARQAAYRNYMARKIQRCPAWADLKAIQKVYFECPDGLTVDHIIPLRGRLVSGLHVAENLQYLSQSDNSKKHNAFTPV